VDDVAHGTADITLLVGIERDWSLVDESEESSSGGDVGVDAESERSGTEDTDSQTEGAVETDISPKLPE